MKLLYAFAFLISLAFMTPQTQKEVEQPNSTDEEPYDDFAQNEWRKFENFKSQLQESTAPGAHKLNTLKSYTRDSLHILTIKLAAIKILEDKQLLDRDIAENTAYYKGLLTQLKDSPIERSDYLFLEDRINVILTENLERRIQYGSWLVYGLALLVLLLGFVIIRQQRTKHHVMANLSRQESAIRNLILEGRSNKEIASELFISLSTVKTHITSIYTKLNVANRQELLKKNTGTST